MPEITQPLPAQQMHATSSDASVPQHVDEQPVSYDHFRHDINVRHRPSLMVLLASLRLAVTNPVDHY